MPKPKYFSRANMAGGSQREGETPASPSPFDKLRAGPGPLP